MAKVMLISTATYISGVNAIGDIVGIFDDDHPFTDHEKSIFQIIDVPNLTRVELLGALKMPQIQTIIDSSGVSHTMWRNADTDAWKMLAKRPLYNWTTNGISAADQALLQSDEVDAATKLTALAAMGNNTSHQPENNTTQYTVTITGAAI